MLIQLVRMLFGAQNVEVANPAWLSGGVKVLPNLILPWNRLAVPSWLLTLSGKILCYAIVAVALDLVWGYAGMLSLGHGIFF
ncbi:hypothetical protein PXW85_27300, partial [Klebsiella pneumoniae]|nr:hypothetical protein [Klebsiella pneumoniae]